MIHRNLNNTHQVSRRENYSQVQLQAWHNDAHAKYWQVEAQRQDAGIIGRPEHTIDETRAVVLEVEEQEC